VRTIVHVNQNTLRGNRKNGRSDPPIAIRRGRRVEYATEVKVGEGRFVYSPDKPLSCGARLWFETLDPVEIVA
jgi:hypothetical protein